ncbi:MAG TPA: DUF3108 domain-containing protein [Psychromonas hadalis]|nr:DUF3108 domain-containing protein [Psychromonas hadalis]
MFKEGFVLLLLSCSLFANAVTDNTSQGKKTKEHYIYSVYYKFISTGQITVDIEHDNDNVMMSSFTDLSFLGISFGGKQTSKISYDPENKDYVTESTVRKSVGFSDVNLSAEFLDNAHRVDVLEEGKTKSYSEKNNKIYGYNSVALNVEEAIRQGKTEFDFYMLTSDDISHYYFAVTGKEKIKTEFGEIDTIRVDQIKKDDRTFTLWFAPSIHGKMVKYHYQRRILDIKGELTEFSYEEL